jgi:DNA-binding MarR family transcriptional regulator
VNFVECHGTGTKRGDVVELTAIGEALQASLRENTTNDDDTTTSDDKDKKRTSSLVKINDSKDFVRPPTPTPPRIAVSSIKSNIGHTKAAAGVAGFLKVYNRNIFFFYIHLVLFCLVFIL